MTWGQFLHLQSLVFLSRKTRIPQVPTAQSCGLHSVGSKVRGDLGMPSRRRGWADLSWILSEPGVHLGWQDPAAGEPGSFHPSSATSPQCRLSQPPHLYGQGRVHGYWEPQTHMQWKAVQREVGLVGGGRTVRPKTFIVDCLTDRSGRRKCIWSGQAAPRG